MIDVAIVGGGPAGSAAAIVCAEAGLVTALFERHVTTPHDSEPEESVAPDSIALLNRLGIDCTAASAPYSAIATGAHVTYFVAAAGMPGRHVRRSWLDAELRAAASKAGADCRAGIDVLDVAAAREGGFVLQTSAGPLTARQLIDASGRRSWLARRLRLSRRRMSPPLVAWREVVEGPRQPGPVARFVPEADGWTFSVQVSPGRVVRTHLRPRHAAEAPSRGAAAHAATWQIVRHLAGDGWFIAGEAAAALDPAAGIGISFALRSGLAAGQAAAASAADSALAPLIAARYDDALLAEFEASAAGLAERYRELGIAVLARGEAPPARS